MAAAIDFLALFSNYYQDVNGDVQPVLVPTAAQIQAAYLGGTLTFPYPVELIAPSLSGGSFRVDTALTRLIPNFFNIPQTQGFVNNFDIAFAASGQAYSRIFEIYPRLGGELSFTVAEYQGFVTTKGNIFAYIQSLLQTTNPAKAIQLDFPGGTYATSFALGTLDQSDLTVPGQVFEFPGSEDKDFYSFTLPDGGFRVEITTSAIQTGVGSLSLGLYKAEAGSDPTLISQLQVSVGSGLLEVSGLVAGQYFLGLDASVDSNLNYSLNLRGVGGTTEPPPLRLDAENAQLLYVSYYGRPADFPAPNEGIGFWQQKIAESGFTYSPQAGDFLDNTELPLYAQIVDDFGKGDEYQLLFAGKNDAQKVDAIYQYCFGRNSEPDPVTGINYWVEQLSEGNITLSQAAVEVALGARGGDRTFLSNRLESAQTFFQQLDTPLERGAYAGAAAGGLALNWLQTFGPTAATAGEADAVIAQIVAAGTVL